MWRKSIKFRGMLERKDLGDTLESLDVGLIIVESIKKTGLGVAIMDRLEKATNRYR